MNTAAVRDPFVVVVTLLSLTSCTIGVDEPVDVNVDQQNRGTVTGTALINVPYQDPDAEFVPIGGADVRLTTGDLPSVGSATHRTTSSSSGGFLLEVPAGSYDVYGCYKTNSGSGGSRGWLGSSSVTVTRGSTVNIGQLRLRWQNAALCGYF